jgi:hypothetical protein
VKLRKQAPAKAFILAATAGLLLAFLGLIRSEPRLQAETEAGPAPDFDRFFAPGDSGASQTAPAIQPHTRTRAS